MFLKMLLFLYIFIYIMLYIVMTFTMICCVYKLVQSMYRIKGSNLPLIAKQMFLCGNVLWNTSGTTYFKAVDGSSSLLAITLSLWNRSSASICITSSLVVTNVLAVRVTTWIFRLKEDSIIPCPTFLQTLAYLFVGTPLTGYWLPNDLSLPKGSNCFSVLNKSKLSST